MDIGQEDLWWGRGTNNVANLTLDPYEKTKIKIKDQSLFKSEPSRYYWEPTTLGKNCYELIMGPLRASLQILWDRILFLPIV
jgi:hypothetical protein